MPQWLLWLKLWLRVFIMAKKEVSIHYHLLHWVAKCRSNTSRDRLRVCFSLFPTLFIHSFCQKQWLGMLMVHFPRFRASDLPPSGSRFFVLLPYIRSPELTLLHQVFLSPCKWHFSIVVRAIVHLRSLPSFLVISLNSIVYEMVKLIGDSTHILKDPCYWLHFCIIFPSQWLVLQITANFCSYVIGTSCFDVNFMILQETFK